MKFFISLNIIEKLLQSISKKINNVMGAFKNICSAAIVFIIRTAFYRIKCVSL